MFTPLEEKQIIELNHQLSHDITIGLVASQHASSKLFHEFCGNLTRLAPKIKISKVAAGPQDPPQILIGSGLRYQAVPVGYELQPFLESIIKEGGAGRLAAMMLDAEKLFPAFYDVLTHNKWPIRLGAMVVIEEIVGKNPDLAAEALSPLWDRFHGASNQIQGDILHVFGEIGDPRSVSWLETVLSGNFDREVKEAAREALNKIK